MDALVPADTQCGTVDETDSRAASHAASLHEQDERDGHLSFQFDKAVVGYGLWKQVGHILANLIQVKVFQTFISTQVEQYHNRYYLGIGQRTVPMVLPLGLVSDRNKAVDLDKSVINVAEVIRHTKISVILSLAIVIARVFVFGCFLFQIYKNFRYFPNNQLVKFHRAHVKLFST